MTVLSEIQDFLWAVQTRAIQAYWFVVVAACQRVKEENGTAI